MAVELVDYTKDAISMLIFTKNTRLLGERTLDDIRNLSDDQRLDELHSMFDTIQSPFEFVDFTFLIKDVSRSFTHQLVRTRNASYAQESLRAVQVNDRAVYNPSGSSSFDDAADFAMAAYGVLVDSGHSIQDAREILPTGVKTNIMMKVNLRELSKMAEVRLCYRTGGEYQEVFKQMRDRVLEIYPELEPMIRVACAKNGRCAFPRYDCPISRQYPSLIGSTQFKEVVQHEWAHILHEADPGIYK